MKTGALIILVLIMLSSCTSGDVILADFEGTNYDGWESVGSAFGDKPTNVNKHDKTIPMGFKGDGLLFSLGIDTGTIISPEFKIKRRYLVYLSSFKNMPEQLGIRILQDGTQIAFSSGNNSAMLNWNYFDLKQYRGKKIQIVVFDNSMANQGGSVLVDHFYMANRLPVIDIEKEFRITERFLNLPVRTGERKKRMSLFIEENYFDEFDIELADSTPQFYVFLDLGDHIGKKAKLSVRSLDRESQAFNYVSVNDKVIKDADDLYTEPMRQQFHFSSRRGWINDPNGLVFYDGEYHMFYQHNPYGWSSGNKHWGHAISKDLIHWHEMPTAIFPRKYGDWAFSGSAIVDTLDTGGFKTGDTDVMLIAYTSTGRGEVIAYSNDKGRSFSEYESNPVIKHRGRDPRILWFEPGKFWVIAVYHEEEGKRYISFYNSYNLKEWTYQSKIEGYYECPELFELKVDGDPTRTKWILYAANGDYTIGSFTGKVFTPEARKQVFNHGNCFYASQTFSNISAQDGRRIQIAWGTVPTPGMPFNHCMLFPVVLTLRSVNEEIRLFAEPIKELELLHNKSWHWVDYEVNNEEDILKGISGELFHIAARLDLTTCKSFEFKLHGTSITYDVASGSLKCYDNEINLSPGNDNIYLDILVDRNTIEIFCNHGQFYMPIARDLTKPYGIELNCSEGVLKIDSLIVHSLNSIWNN